MTVNKQSIDVLHGRLTALEALMFMVPSDSGPAALHQAIEGIDKQSAETPADARELAALKMRHESVLASLERD